MCIRDRPQAQLDRFMVRLEMGYPDFASQVNILRDRQTGDPLEAVATVSSCAEVLAMQKEAHRPASGPQGRLPHHP